MGPLHFWFAFFCDWLVPEVERGNYLSVRVQKSGGWWIMINFHCPILFVNECFAGGAASTLQGVVWEKQKLSPVWSPLGSRTRAGDNRTACIQTHSHTPCPLHPTSMNATWHHMFVIVLVLQTRVLMNGWGKNWQNTISSGANIGSLRLRHRNSN